MSAHRTILSAGMRSTWTKVDSPQVSTNRQHQVICRRGCRLSVMFTRHYVNILQLIFHIYHKRMVEHHAVLSCTLMLTIIFHRYYNTLFYGFTQVCVCVRACVVCACERACVRACVCVCPRMHFGHTIFNKLFSICITSDIIMSHRKGFKPECVFVYARRMPRI